MSDTNFEPENKDAYRADSKAERRERRQHRVKTAPVTARYGIWTGQGFLREGAGLEKRMAEESLTVGDLPSTRREKRRSRKRKGK